MLNTQELF